MPLLLQKSGFDATYGASLDPRLKQISFYLYTSSASEIWFRRYIWHVLNPRYMARPGSKAQANILLPICFLCFKKNLVSTPHMARPRSKAQANILLSICFFYFKNLVSTLLQKSGFDATSKIWFRRYIWHVLNPRYMARARSKAQANILLSICFYCFKKSGFNTTYGTS